MATINSNVDYPTLKVFKSAIADKDFQIASPDFNGIGSVYGPGDRWHCLVMVEDGIVLYIYKGIRKGRVKRYGNYRLITPNPWLSPRQKGLV